MTPRMVRSKTLGSLVTLQHEGPVAVVSLARPEKRNAMTPGMLDEFLASLRSVRDSTARAVVVRGEGSVFCSGFDLPLCHAEPGTLARLLTGLSVCVGELRSLDVPVVIACHGAAIAGGCALLGGADVVVADRGAKIGYPVVPLGISPAVSASSLRSAVVDGAARAWQLDPVLHTGEEAHAMGLVHELVESAADVMGRARAVALALAGKPAWAISATKAWLNRLTGPTVDEARRSLDASLALSDNAEQREALGTLASTVWRKSP